MRRIALVICAKNEAFLIRSTVETARKALRTGDALFVIADNCTDRTAVEARSAGAEVIIRDQSYPPGKGAAISWFVKTHSQRLLLFSYLVILDADSIIDSNFISVLDQSLGKEECAAQCFVSPVGYEESPVGTLAALSETVEQTIFEHLHAKVGWPVRLRGTGMIFSPKVLMDLDFGIDSEVEDMVLSLLLTEKKVHIHAIENAQVFDPKPLKAAAASRQRSRWYRGQLKTFWDYRRTVVKILFSGLGGCSLLGSLFLKPRWLKMLVMLLLCGLLINYPWVALPILSVALSEVALFTAGLIRSPNRYQFFRALWYLPGFILMWIRSILMSTQKKSWLSVRDTQTRDEHTNGDQKVSRNDWDEWLKYVASQKGVK